MSVSEPALQPGAGAARARHVPHRWRNLATLTGVTVVDSTEASMITNLFPSIAATLRLNNEALGLLAASGKVISLPFGIGWVWLAARTSRKVALVAAATSGGVFGIMAGFAETFLFLLVANTLMSACVIGAGPIANAVIADSFDDDNRSRAVGTFYGVSSLLTAFFGPATAQLSGLTDGWRYGMWVMGTLCILTGIAVIALFREPLVGAAEAQLADLPPDQHGARPVTWSSVLGLFRIPTFSVMMVSRLLSGHLLITVFGVQFLVTERGFSNAVAAAVLLPYGIGYFIGALTGGWVVAVLDRVLPYHGRVALLQVGQVLFAVAAYFCTQFVYDGIVVYAGFCVLMGAMQALNPVANRPMIMSVVLPELRGQAFAIFLTIFDTIGWGVFALVAGVLADEIGVQTVFFWGLVVLMLVNAVWITLFYLTYPRDAARVTAVLDARRHTALLAPSP
ncbi:MAG: MFS transporter [Propionibacteriaceae bacterium]